MGKKDKGDFGSFDPDECKKIADQLEEYADTVSTLVIINDKPKKKVKKALKRVRAAVKDLREGHPEKVFNPDAFSEYQGESFNFFDD